MKFEYLIRTLTYSDDHNAILNDCGLQGWELVGLSIFANTTNTKYVFKRILKDTINN